jgi:hypothetical protein
MPNVTFYQLTQFFNSLATAHPNIKSFTVGDLDEVDLMHQTLYPLCHLVPNNVIISPQTFTYNIELLVMDRIVNVTQESEGVYNSLLSNYRDVTNIHDVWNTSLLTINDIVAYITRNAQADNFMIETDSICTPFQDRFNNGLAGWSCVMNVLVPNDVNACLFAISDLQATGGESCS